MANAPESPSFIEMFTRLGRDLKMPSMDVEKIIQHHRRNLETLEKTAQAATAGATSLMAKQREIMEEALREVADMAESFRSPGNPQDMVAKQAEFARRSFEAAVKNASEMAEVVRQSSTETIEILRERIREAMQDVREDSEKRK
jgi:phasin family protein